MKKQGLLTLEGGLILASVFVNSVPLGYMTVVPLVYLVQIGYSPVTIGLIYAASGVANTVGYAPFGVLADKFGRRNFLILGSVIPAAAYAIFGLTLNPDLLVVASVIGGVGLAGGLATAITSPSVLPLLADSSPAGNRTTLFAAYQGVYTVGLSVGSFLSFLPSFLGGRFSWDSTMAHSNSYYIMAVLVACSIIPLLLVSERERRISAVQLDPKGSGRETDATGEDKNHRWGYVTSWSKVAKFSLTFGISGFGFGIIVELLPTWYHLSFGVSETTIGFWTAAAQFLSLVAIPTIPFLVRKRGIVNLTLLTGSLGCIPLILMPFSGSFELAASLFIVRSIILSVYVPVIQSYIAGAVTEKERATTFGIVFTAWGVANSVGTVLAGDLLAANLLTIPFIVGVGAYLASTLTFFGYFHGSKLPEEMPLLEVVPEKLT